MLCTTRIRDSRVGFSSSFQYGFITDNWGFARIELDENAIEHSNNLIVRSEKDSRQYKPHISAYNTKKWNYKDRKYGWITSNWENQHEERILSNNSVIDNAIQYIRRIDFLIRIRKNFQISKSIEIKEYFCR